MSENKQNGSGLEIIFIFVGIFLFLTGLVGRKAVNGLTKFCAYVDVFFLDLSLVLMLLSKAKVNPELVNGYEAYKSMFWSTSVIYVILLVLAYIEDFLFYRKQARLSSYDDDDLEE